MKLSRLMKTSLAAGAACLLLGGCTISAGPAARPVVYQPEPYYYDGYAVHYDSAGPHAVYAGRAPRYVSRSHPRYSEVSRKAPRRHRHSERHDGRRY